MGRALKKDIILPAAIMVCRFAIGALFLCACTKMNFEMSSVNASGISSTASMQSVQVSTKKNKSVIFSAGATRGLAPGASLSFSASVAQVNATTNNGTFQVVNPTSFDLSYTPNNSFVGSDQITVFGIDSSGNVAQASVTVIVGNTLNSTQPALAVRGPSCITCHSNVSSNVLTDYGYGSPWYFGVNSGTIDSPYFDRLGEGNGLATLSLLNNSQIIVPAAQVPSDIQTMFNITSLAQFVQARFAQGSTNTSSQVREVASLKINIPTAQRIQQLFQNPTSNLAFLPDTQNSPPLQGIVFDPVNKVFNLSNLVCDGDLYLGASVVFENAKIQSINGCRIYATGNVFIDGAPIESLPYKNSVNFNTQLMSAQSIWMGTGRIWKNNAFCEVDAQGAPTGYYTIDAQCTMPGDGDLLRCDTMEYRAADIMARNTYSNAFPNTAALLGLFGTTFNGQNPGSAIQDHDRVELSLGHALYDASCGPNGRDVDVSRLMLVAPYVNNRYTGNFSGSTIAEMALMSLGTFTYQFDPVFNNVSIFSLLDNGELISGQGL